MVRASMHGKAFEAEIRNSLQAYAAQHPDDFWYMRLPDYRTWIAANKNLVHPKQPADFLAIHRGAAHFIECKSSKKPNGWRLDYLKDHQAAALTELEKAGAKSWILICDRSTPRKNKCYALNINNWQGLKEHLDHHKRKTVHWNEISPTQKLPLHTGKTWGLETILD